MISVKGKTLYGNQTDTTYEHQASKYYRGTGTSSVHWGETQVYEGKLKKHHVNRREASQGYERGSIHQWECMHTFNDKFCNIEHNTSVMRKDQFILDKAAIQNNIAIL